MTEAISPNPDGGASTALETDRHGLFPGGLEELPEGRRCSGCRVMVFTDRDGCPTCGKVLPGNRRALTHSGYSKLALRDSQAEHEQRLRKVWGLPEDRTQPHHADGLVVVLALLYARLERAGAYSIDSPQSLTSDRQLATDRIIKVCTDGIRDYTRLLNELMPRPKGGENVPALKIITFGGRYKRDGTHEEYALPEGDTSLDDQIGPGRHMEVIQPAVGLPLVIDHVSTRAELLASLDRDADLDAGGDDEADGRRVLPVEQVERTEDLAQSLRGAVAAASLKGWI